MIQTKLRLLLVFILLLCSPAYGGIYRCVEDSGVVLYAQFPCANAELISERQVSVIETPELTESERLMLSRIEKNSAALHRASHKRANQRLRQRVNHKREQISLCQKALVGMVDLRARKRAGYSVAKSAAYDKREDELRLQRSENC